MDLTGHVAVITGAAVGIGRAIAQAVAVEGAVTVVADIDAEDLARTADLIRVAGGQAIEVPTDVTDAEAVTALLRRADEGDGIRLLVNNAGGVAAPYWPDAEPGHWAAAIDLNLRAPMLVTQLALPHTMVLRFPSCSPR